MPMIDVYTPADLFPVGSDRQLAEELTSALLRSEGVTTPAAVHLNNTAAYIHRLDPKAVHTAATDSARTVRVQVITPPGALNRDGQKSLVAEATQIIAKIAGDPTQAARTWVLLTQAAEGGRMFDNNGESGLPCGVPSLRVLATPPSIIPASR
jgi:phenylpyruvate tautomerase PptA (4-oxalocrotonate tautomerase family)